MVFITAARQASRVAITRSSVVTPRVLGSSVVTSFKRWASDKAEESNVPELGVTGRIPTSMEQSFGREREELEALRRGDDVYLTKGYSGPLGVLNPPIEVPSRFTERVVACNCQETFVTWVVVKKDSPDNCPSCGQRYYLTQVSH
eukprot:Clim_evm23s202 gene=Clim_evmTU23s202